MSSVLVVDDEAAMRRLMTRWVEMAGHSASEASNAEEALESLSEEPSAIALCDVRMPGHDGVWLAKRIRTDFPDTAVIMATAVRDTDPRVAEHSGAVDYLLKPFGRDRLKFALERGLDWHQTAAARREWTARLAEEMRERGAELTDAVEPLRGGGARTLDAVLEIIATRDPDLLAHSRRVAGLAVRIGDALGLSEADLRTLREGGLLHDFGKLGLPEAILSKPAALGFEEKEIVRQHPEIGARLLSTLEGLESAAAVVYAAAEQFDGFGYPQGLCGDEVPLAGRIVAVADAFDAMTHTRIYRDAISAADATCEIMRCSGTQFDPIVSSTLAELVGGQRPTQH